MSGIVYHVFFTIVLIFLSKVPFRQLFLKKIFPLPRFLSRKKAPVCKRPPSFVCFARFANYPKVQMGKQSVVA